MRMAVVMCLFSQVRQSVEEYITKKPTHGKREQDIREVLPLFFASYEIDVHCVDQKDRHNLYKQCRDERLDNERQGSHPSIDHFDNELAVGVGEELAHQLLMPAATVMLYF